jgi:CPA2 family monovalent cation:H+ antiporter-2
VILLGLAALMGVLAERLRQSAIVGYLLAGALAGPGGFALIGTGAGVEMLAELGVALLLFTIGLEFSLQRLKALGAFAGVGGTLQIVLTTALFSAGALAFGLPFVPALVIGLLAAPSSTACVLRMLRDRTEMDSVHGRAATGVLLLQDLALVPMVLLVTTLGGEGTPAEVLGEVAKATVLFALLIAGFWVISVFVLPRLFQATAAIRNREILVLLAATIALGSAWAAHALHLSPALGAFMAGLLLAGSPFAAQLRADVSVLRTLFVTLFFASIGMLADFAWIGSNVVAVIVAVFAVIVGKALVIAPLGRLFRFSWGHGVAAALCLAQVGEFSFVLGEIARAGGILSEFFFNLLVSTALITMLLTPFLVASAPRVRDRLRGMSLRRAGSITRPSLEQPAGEAVRGHVVVIGYGPAGRQILNALRDRRIPISVVDLNPRGVTQALREGAHEAHVGDATHGDILEHAHLRDARALVVTIPDHSTAISIIRQATAYAPRVPIFTRSRYTKYSPDLAAAGARVTLDEEESIGRALANRLLEECH